MADYFIGITDKGRRRDHNEDTFIAQRVFNGEYLLACVIDGVGGYSGGEVAAEIARTVILDKLQNITGDVVKALREAVVAANEKIQEKKGDDNKNMACVLTCAIVDIKKNKFYYAHVGDTRLYLLRDRSLVKVSKDHSAIGFLEESGKLSEEDAMRHPRRNEINRALGFETLIGEVDDYIETGESAFLPGDTILLCSDGLSDMINSETIMSILDSNKTLSEKAIQLVHAANEAGGNDNITAVLVENNKQPKKIAVVKPTETRLADGKRSNSSTGKSSLTKIPTTSKRFNRPAAMLGILSFILMIALGASFLQHNNKTKASPAVLASVPQKLEDENLTRLISGIADSVKAYTLPANISLTVSEPILINKDSFHLLGNGSVIRSDSNYNGAAFIIPASAMQIILDSVVFENFDVALLVHRNNIIFRNVKFINCRMPVQYAVPVNDTIISGRLSDSIFISNSIIKKH